MLQFEFCPEGAAAAPGSAPGEKDPSLSTGAPAPSPGAAHHAALAAVAIVGAGAMLL